MIKKILVTLLILIIPALVIGDMIQKPKQDYVIDKTELQDNFYLVKIKDMPNTIFSFDMKNIAINDLPNLLNEKVRIQKVLNEYNSKVKSGLPGCNTTEWCLANGWSEKYTCIGGKCEFTDLKINLTKNEIDEVLK